MGLTAACAIRAAYSNALRRVSDLMNCEPDTPEAAELDRLADFCVAYEAANFPWNKATP